MSMRPEIEVMLRRVIEKAEPYPGPVTPFAVEAAVTETKRALVEEMAATNTIAARFFVLSTIPATSQTNGPTLYRIPLIWERAEEASKLFQFVGRFVKETHALLVLTVCEMGFLPKAPEDKKKVFDDYGIKRPSLEIPEADMRIMINVQTVLQKPNMEIFSAKILNADGKRSLGDWEPYEGPGLMHKKEFDMLQHMPWTPYK